jgi:hypothetical protein
VRTAFPVDRLRHQLVDRLGDGHLPQGDEGAETVYRYRTLIFDSVAALDVFLFRFSYKSALVVTRILMAILISHFLEIV